MHATIVAPVVTDDARRLAGELARDAIELTVTSADVLRARAEQQVYVFLCAGALAVALAPRIVEWGARLAGLIGVLPDGGSDEREALLAAGFDDVVTGRLSARELSARIRAVHRRLTASRAPRSRLRHGALTLDLLERALWTHGRTIVLTATELEVMRELILAGGRPLSRSDLLERVWGVLDSDVTDRAVDNVILRLRRKLPRPDMLETVRGVGFRLA